MDVKLLSSRSVVVLAVFVTRRSSNTVAHFAFLLEPIPMGMQRRIPRHLNVDPTPHTQQFRLHSPWGLVSNHRSLETRLVSMAQKVSDLV